MYIKSVVIDGFKSYAHRTEVNGFDPKFNAITGLNGSGKSNILDSICFLLGISNLSQVRATNLQELVYKNGQAGVTKATVSICFDNSDKRQSPLGYEQYDEISVTRQVVIGGRNKYLINGSNANNSRVQDMFRSVQLNINNPHFLIMQGRITKVLNMKPPEILSMIEEATGTRLYESKKEAAQKTIEKKDAKLREIDTIVKEEISPTLTRLKQERSSYLEYQKILRQLEHLNKFYIAYRFVVAKETEEQSAHELLEMQTTKQRLIDRQKEIAVSLKEIDSAICVLEKKRDKQAGGVLEKLESKVTERQKEDAKSTSNISNKKDTLKAEKKKMNQLTKQLANDNSASQAKKKELAKIEEQLVTLSDQSAADAEGYAAAQKHFHAVSAGLSSNEDGKDASLSEQLISAKKEISAVQTETKTGQMHLKHAESEIKKKQADLKKTDTAYNKDKTAHEAHLNQIKKIKAEMDKLGYEDGHEESLQTKHRQLTQEAQALREKVDQFEARFPQLQFEYRNPEKNFDRKRVHGLVSKLIKVKDPKTATALEVCAGGKLYNVVVDTEVTGKLLLQKGDLHRRYTIIPLNKISARAISSDVVRQAENLVGKKNVSTALSLVGYESQLQAAMEFVFGSAFICNSMDDAKRVTYDSRINRKSVTLEGDSFDPSGTLTGGARAQTSSILVKLTELNEAQSKLNECEAQLKGIEEQIRSVRYTANKYRTLKQQFELRLHEANLMEERMKQSTHHQQLEEMKALEAAITEHETTLAQATERQAAATKRVMELEDKIKNSKEYRQRELKAAEKELASAKSKADKTRVITKEKQQEVASLKLELEEITKDLGTCEKQISATADTIKGFEEQLEELCAAGNETKDAVKAAQGALTEQKELLKACNKDISDKINDQRTLQKDDNAAQLQLQELEHKVSKCKKDAKDAARQVEALLEKYDWIEEEKKYFGQTNTSYDFKTQDPKDCAKTIQKLEETKDKLAKSVNMRAMNMLGKAEEQYDELMKKRQIVLGDKAKIEQVIRELDEKKNEALKKAHVQVNRDFGSIFSTLLPGSQAKLVAPDGQDILDGLEVKIGFGNVWKESLSELSGGQRSLVALSLILSLLLFKPAPLYILDEVDAALDLSHTQNIGQMLRNHFTHSQFIVVSLKDGMFNNANVLFKTKFVDGVSTVTRYAQQSSRAPLSSTSLNNAGGGRGKKSKTLSKRPRIDTSALDSENVE